MAENESFLNYLDKAKKLSSLQQELAGTMGKSRSIDYGTIAPPKVSKPESQGGGDPVSTLIDILSRPLYTVTNVPNQILNEEAKRKEAQLTGESFDTMGAIGNVLSAPFRGLLSTNPEDKITTAQLIEKQSDVSNIGNPDYVDVQNNVNPAVAGSLGLIGDIGLDFSMYVPVGGWAVKGLKAGTQAIKAGTRGALTSVDAAEQLRYGKNIPKKTAEGEAAAEDLIQAYGADNVEDIKIKPVGETDKTSAAADIVAETDQSVKKASETSAKAKAGIKVEDIEVDVPPSITEILSKLPTRSSGRTQLGVIGNVMANIRRNTPVAGKRIDKMDDWQRQAVNDVVRAENAGGATATTRAVKASLADPEKSRELYARYLKSYDENNGLVNIFGVPKPRTSVFRDVNEWVASAADDAVLAKYPARFAKPAGSAGVTKAQAQEFLSAGTLNGKKLTENQAASLRKQLDEGLDALGGPTVDSVDGFVKRIKDMLGRDSGAAADNLLGPKLAANMRKMGDERLAMTAKLIEDIASGEHSLDGFTGSLVTKINKKTGKAETDSYSSTINALGELLGIGDVAAYNLARRKTISEINSAKSAEYAAAIREGRDIEEMMVQAGFTSNEGKRVAEWFPSWLRSLVEKGDSEFVTDTGVRRTSDTKGVGYAYDLREIGTHESWNMVQSAQKWAIAEASKRGLSGKARSEFVMRQTMSELAMAEKMLDNFGWPMWISLHHKGSRFLVSPSQLMAVMGKVDKDLLLKSMYNVDTMGPYTFMSDAIVESLVRGKPLAGKQLRDVLTGKTAQEYYKTIDKFFDKPKRNGFVSGGVYGRKGKESVEFTADELVEQFENALPKIVTELEPLILKNSNDYQTRFGKEAGDLASSAINDMEALAADKARVGRMLNYIDNLEQNMALVGKEGAALDVSILRAIEVALDIVPKGTRVFAKETAKASTKAKRAGSAKKLTTPAKATAAQKTANAKKVDKEIEKETKPELEKKLEEATEEAKLARAEDEVLASARTPEEAMSNEAYGNINANRTALHKPDGEIWGAIASRLSRNYNLATVSNMWHSLGGMSRQLRHNYTHRLRELDQANNKFDGMETPIITKIFSDLQLGQPTKGYEELYEKVRLLTAEVEDVTGEFSLLGNPFFRNQQGIEKINDYMKMVGIKDEYLIDIQLASERAAEKGTDLWTEASQMWRELPIDDPVQYLAQKHAALMKLNTNIAVAKDFKRMAIENGLVSKTPKPGYVKTQGLDGDFFEFLDDSDYYFDATIVKELQYLSDIADDSRSMSGKLGNFVNKYFLPLQNSWKYAITLPRPGHHIRNAIGDASLTYMAEGARHFMTSLDDAFKIISIGKRYDDVDIYKAMQSRGITDIPTRGDVLFRIGDQEISTGWSFEAMQRQGLFPTYVAGEDFVDDIIQPSVVSKIADKLTLRGGKIEETAGAFSQWRDHVARGQHFMQILRKEKNNVGPGKKFKNLDELVEYAGKRTKKFHPDATMLTAWEAKYMRTLIPFYSWFRGALPAIIEATVIYPNRFMVFPKASFNLAYAMGLNPYSLSDPFPDDQMFPSFLTEDATGPQFNINGNYFGMNPGIAALDVYNQIGTGEPLRGIAGMTSPLLRVPLELMSGGAWGTGARIKDPSDYVDASLPGINYASNISGYSVTGSVASLLSGQGLDPQYQVDAGNKSAADQATSFLNWITGLGFQNMSKQNYQDFAEIEKRNAMAEDKRSAY